MIREVYENRHPDGGIPELVTYATCDDCGVDVSYGDAYFIGDAKDGKECYCKDCAINYDWVECCECGDIVEEKNTETIETEYDSFRTLCHSCLDKLEEES